tara:strand:- start:646 stop:1344 length:699 start_codon:yes stop_codon:yes gene_type:complete
MNYKNAIFFIFLIILVFPTKIISATTCNNSIIEDNVYEIVITDNNAAVLFDNGSVYSGGNLDRTIKLWASFLPNGRLKSKNIYYVSTPYNIEYGDNEISEYEIFEIDTSYSRGCGDNLNIETGEVGCSFLKAKTWVGVSPPGVAPDGTNPYIAAKRLKGCYATFGLKGTVRYVDYSYSPIGIYQDFSVAAGGFISLPNTVYTANDFTLHGFSTHRGADVDGGGVTIHFKLIR